MSMQAGPGLASLLQQLDEGNSGQRLRALTKLQVGSCLLPALCTNVHLMACHCLRAAWAAGLHGAQAVTAGAWRTSRVDSIS